MRQVITVVGVGSRCPASPALGLPEDGARCQAATAARCTCFFAPDGRTPPGGVAESQPPPASPAAGVGSSRTATDKGVPTPLPLRPSAFCRARRACQDSSDSPSLKLPATGVGSSEQSGQGTRLDGEHEQATAAVSRPDIASS